VFKKISTRNAEKLTKSLLEQLPDEIEFEQSGTMLAREAVKEAEQLIKPKVKKLSQKIMLQDATEAVEETKEIDIVPVIKQKKITRKKKIVDFNIIDEV
jgi:hypothetical protein